MKSIKIIAIISAIIFFQGCTKDVDFNQLDDANIHSTYIATLIYLNLTAPDFLDDLNREITLTTDLVRVPITDDAKPYLEKVEFTVISENSFDRNFKLSITFYDAFNKPIYMLQPINVTKNSTTLTTIIEIPKQDIPYIFNTKYFGFSLLLSPSTDGSIININDTSAFDLKSSAKLFFNYSIK